ncbi:MAG TPA: anti-sigma factor [Rhodocyclaceae bacterium]|nr:anti-sigma factor [Rhodocyclaceae bacterium]HMW78499.1 anti-sigma factor [Rhodocyclaceae bacterium]HNE42307.1 anti-sigma factor [Rhodocyclaceae bacterium]HNL21502.1 anti-sigma factor [Rhodocyclaceae bacterium]HNM81312.1 anti-sigma factor [Rhodocyclaceae bacterium]
MNASLPPNEDELHAYVDGELETDRRAAIAAWLGDHPDAAARVADWQEQKRLLFAAYGPIMAEVPPPHLEAAANRRPRASPPLGLRLAAAVGWLALGAVIGYGVKATSPAREAGLSPIAHSAAIAHVVYTPEVRHPVEVAADQEAHLVQWLSKRLGMPLRVPQLSADGFALVGGRLLPGESGPVAQFMYEDGSGKRLTLYVRADAAENRETAFRFALEGKVGVFYWLDGKLGYAISGELPREKLLNIAESAYKQLNP